MFSCRDATVDRVARSATLFGVGVYDLLEASHLLGIDERQLRRWAQRDDSGRPPLLEPSHGWAYSFHDLLSLAVIAVLRQRTVTPDGVRETIRQLEVRFEYRRPLAHQDVVDGLRTVGRSVILPSEETDLSAGGQGVLLTTVEQYLRPIEYGPDKLARLWRPADRIVVDPDIQVGHPCIENTRVTTETIAGRAAQHESFQLIADDLRVSVFDVTAAVNFEQRLDEGRGLALVN